ncbi:MAG: glycosyltransferase family 2 protein [Planctomycetota bacterium]
MPALGPISVVVVNWNGERYLDGCLESVAALEGGVSEVLVVDNASTDGSVALLRERHPTVRVVRLDENRGPARARNAGMRAAANRWVLALDNDAVLSPDVLAKLAAAAASAPGIAIAQPRSVFHSEPGRIHYDGGRFHYAGLISLRNFYKPLAEGQGAGTLDVDCAVAVALLVDRDALLEAGGYDEDYFILFEDLDLSYRLRALGHRIVSVEDAIVLHRGGTPGISFREGPSYPGSRVFYHSRNRWLFLAKDYRVRTIVVALPGLLLYEGVWFGFAVLSGGLGAWLRGKRQFFGLLPRLREKRRAFQSIRRARDRELLVGGPLTVTPAVRSSAWKRVVLGALDVALRGWWGSARFFAG